MRHRITLVSSIMVAIWVILFYIFMGSNAHLLGKSSGLLKCGPSNMIVGVKEPLNLPAVIQNINTIYDNSGNRWSVMFLTYSINIKNNILIIEENSQLLYRGGWDNIFLFGSEKNYILFRNGHDWWRCDKANCLKLGSNEIQYSKDSIGTTFQGEAPLELLNLTKPTFGFDAVFSIVQDMEVTTIGNQFSRNQGVEVWKHRGESWRRVALIENPPNPCGCGEFECNGPIRYFQSACIAKNGDVLLLTSEDYSDSPLAWWIDH